MPDDKAYLQWAVKNIQNIYRVLPSLAGIVSSSLDYFLTDIASDLGGYFRMQDSETGAATSSFSEAGLGVGNHLVDTWATPIGEPGAHSLLAGLYDGHFHAERTAGNRTLQFYWELYTRTHPGGVETLRMISALSSAVTTEVAITTHAAIGSDVELNETDRLVWKLYAAVSGVGANVSFDVHAEGDHDSHVTVPITTGALSNIFVRRDGTIDLSGNWVITTNNITLSAGTLTARILVAGDATNAGTVHIHDGAGKKQVLTSPVLAADVPFIFPPALRVGEYLKCGVAGAHVFDVPAGGGATLIGHGDTPGAFTYGQAWVNAAGNALDFSNNFNPDVVPTAPNALDDEFEGAGALDVKWSLTNDPAGGNALSQAVYPGFLKVGLTEVAAPASFDAAVRIHQTPPTGTAVMTYIAKVSIALTTYGDRFGEVAGVFLYLGDSVNDEFICPGFRLLDFYGIQFPGQLLSQEDNGGGGFQGLGTNLACYTNHSQWVYLKLEKTTANDYDGANTYNCYYSLNGTIWTFCGTDTKTFGANCDEVGLMFIKPFNQAGAPVVEIITDFFRRVV